MTGDLRHPLRGIAPGAATNGQGVVLDSGIWVPGNVVRSLASTDGSVTIDATDPLNPDLSVTADAGVGIVQSIVAGTNITVDSTDPANPIVATTFASLSPYALDPTSLDATYGDHFTNASLAAKWTRVGWTSTGESFQQGGGTWFQQDTTAGTNSYYWQAAPSGDFTVVMSAVHYASSDMFGPLILDSSGNGVAAVAAVGEGNYVRGVAAGVQNGTSAGIGALTSAHVMAGARTWFRLNKTGTSYKASISTNGAVWRPWTAPITFANAVTRIGFGNVFGSTLGFAIDFFDVQ